MDIKQKVISESSTLSILLKTELLEYLLTKNLQTTQNINGHFFLLSNFSDEVVEDIYNKIQYLKTFQEDDDDIEDTQSELSEQNNKSDLSILKKKMLITFILFRMQKNISQILKT